MERVPEPELMDDLEQARAYAEADFDESNTLCIDLVTGKFPDWPGGGAILDLGCGPGDITIRLARAFPACQVHGLDGSQAMLDFADAALAATPGLGDRVRFIFGLVPGARLPREKYDAVVSNSLLHHLHDPAVMWETVKAVAAPGAPVMIMDLFRLPTIDEARGLVDRYAAGDPEVLRTDFYNSLLAAFEVEEVRVQLDRAGLGDFRVEQVSDRHLAAWGRMPES